MVTSYQNFIGIDIGKFKNVVAVHTQKSVVEFDNNASGWQQLFKKFSGILPNSLGSVDKILEKPYKSSNKIEKTHKNLSSFIKSGKNAPKIFNFTKKTLNQMTFFVDMLIVIPLHFSIPFWRNNHCTSLVFKTCNKGIAIVGIRSEVWQG